MRTIIAILLLTALLVACASENDAPPPTAPAAPAAAGRDAPVAAPQDGGDAQAGQDTGGAAQAVVTGADKVLGSVNKTGPLGINDVQCDLAERSITFRFRNDDNRTWNLANNYGFSEPGVPKEKVNVQVEINSYQANSQTQPVNSVTKEILFGPNWPFAQNCGGVAELRPGEDVTCTLQPVPLKNSTGLTQGFNEIFIKTPTSKHRIQFTCG